MAQPPASVYPRLPDDIATLERKRRQAEQERIAAIADREAKSKAESDRASEEDESQRDRLSKIRVSQPPDLRHLEIGDETVKVKESDRSVYGDKLQAEEGKRAEAARRKRQEALDTHLKDYDSDPMSQAIGKAQFSANEYKAYQAKRKTETDAIIAEHPDDPMAQALAVAAHRVKEQRNQSPASQAFAKNEAIERMKRVDEVNSRFADDGTGNAFVRETFGALRNTGAGITALAARLTGNSDAADEVHRQTNEYDAAQQQARDANDMSPWLSRQYGGTVGSLTQSMATPGGAFAKGIGAGIFQGSESLTTADDAGLQGAARLRYAATQATAETAFELLGQKFFGPGIEGRMVGQAIAARTFKELGKNTTKDIVGELPGEFFTTVVQDVSSKLEGVSPNMTKEDFISHVVDMTAQTVLMSSMVNAPNALAIAGKSQKQPQGPSISDKRKDLRDTIRNRMAGQFTPDPNLIDSTRQPVSQDEPAVAAEIAAFANAPSRKTYDAALKAGLDPRADKKKPDGTGFLSEDGRKKYAADVLKDPFGFLKPDPRMDQSPNVPPAINPVDVPDNDSDELLNQYESLFQKGEPDEKRSQDPESPADAQGQGQGQLQNEGEMKVPPARTQDEDRPAEPQDAATPVDPAKTAFEQEYRDTFAEWQKHPRESQEFRNADVKMTAMDDAQPDWAQEIEDSDPNWTKTWLKKMRPQTANDTEASPVATGEPSPDQSPTEAGPVSQPETSQRSGGFDSDAFELERNDRIKASRESGVTHLDKVPPSVETMRGREIFYVHDPKVKGTVRTVANTGEVVVNWSDKYSADKELATEQTEGNGKTAKKVFQTWLMPSDLKDYAFADSVKTPETASIEPAPQVKPPVPDFAALPQKSQDLFNKAFESKDTESLKQMVAKNNVAWNNEFESRTGVKLPKNLKDRHQAVLDWAKPVEPPAPTPATTKPAKPTRPEAGRSLRAIVLVQGGISVKSLRKDYNHKELRADGLLGVMRTSGQPLDEIAQVLVSSGDLRVPADRNPADWLIEQLKLNADGARAEYSDAEMAKREKAERELYAQREEYGIEAEVLDGLRSSSEEEGTRAADAGESGEEISDAETEVIDNSFEAEAANEAFTLTRPPKPRPKKEDFGTNANTKQGGLFDAGKKGDKKGQELLFNSDAGDLNNPRTQENKAKAAESQEAATPAAAPVESDIKAAMRAELARLAAEEAAAKPPLGALTVKDLRSGKETVIPEKAPAKRPATPKAPRTATGDKLGKLSAKTGKSAAKAMDDFLDEMKDLGVLSGLGVNNKALMATAKMVRAQIADGVVKFADFVARFVEHTSPATARKLSEYLEAAWDISAETDSRLDAAGKVADVLGPEKEVANEDRPDGNEPTRDGGRETAGRPLGETPLEEPSSDIVSTDEGGRDTGRSGDPSGARSGGEESGTVSDGDEAAGSVPASPAGDDRTAGRRGRIDFRITGEDQIGVKFNFRERFEKNVEAIKVLKQVESENRRATPEEQKILVQYVGWGGLKEAFSTRADQGLREKAILKDLLTEQELAQARTSVRNAHYTSPEVISAMWEGLTDAGFAGGRILEPSAGIGHFYGLVPESVAELSKLSGIEMDGLTARIAQQLYQTADITHAPYQDVNVKNLQDLVISNVPFGPYKAKDKYNKALKKKSSIHNFFFLKAMTNVRPGGVIAFITSRYTMDGRTAEHMEVREQITAGGGRFVGAVRLPNNAFMGIAKTKVTTDVIFIQKDAGDAQPWRNTKEDAGGFIFNEYFHDHPENVLGKIDPKGGTQMNEWGIAPDGHDIGKELAQKIAAMPFDRSALAENSTENAETAEDTAEDSDVPDGRLAIKGNTLFLAVGGKLEETPLWGGERGQERKFGIIRAMGSLASVRDKLSQLETSSLATDAEIEQARKLLNTAYDRFVKEHGFVYKNENQGLFREDEQLPTLLAMEEWDSDNKTAKKADVFETRVQQPDDIAANPTTAEGAAVESYARLGRIDLPMISEWLGKSESRVEQELTGWAYKDPATGEWSLKNVYLSGNIAKKLKDAEAAAKKDPAFQKNVEDLKRVLPPRKKAGEIHVRPRSPFITADQYHQFMRHLGVNGIVRHDDITGSWQIDNPHIEDAVKAGPWGVGRKTAADLLEGLLNNKPPLIWGKDDDGVRRVNEALTQLARAKSKEIEDEFGKWIFADPDRAMQIEDAFNEGIGAYIEGEWDGSHLTLPGMNINITLLPHQLNAIWRAIVSGNTLMAHEVGLGKTFIMAAIAMERKRLGLATNQMFVVPNHLLAQWTSEFKALYPSAKLLALQSDQINSKNRRTLMERVKSGRFDAIIVTPEAYKKMPMSNDVVQAALNAITLTIENTIKEAKKAKGENKNFVAKLESVLESIRGKMTGMLNDPAKDAGAKFDELGIDSLYVDEAHEYRNLWSMTQMGDISGVGLAGNQKTFDMLLKTDYLNERTKNRGLVFATGTPIANSISELYSMQRYLQPQTLAEAGVASFDDWANTFGEAITDIEVDPTGSGFRSKTRFKEFRNTIALSKMFRQVADVKYAEDVGLDKVRPKLRGGKLHAIQVMPSMGLLGYVRNLVRRLEISKSRSFDKRIDNPLKVTTDGRKAALDMRLVADDDSVSSKVNIAVENVARIYREEEERKGVQLLWVNLGTPASAKKKPKVAKANQPAQDDSPDAQMNAEEENLETGRISLYEDIKQKLIAQGIPENEIAFIHDHDSPDRKRALFQKARDGKVRILISTIKKLATGANIQTRLAGMHFFDPPWKPADIEQAVGRAIRRGNLYKDWGGVQAYTYVTKGSFDAYIWQLLENKAKAIKQIMRGEIDSVEDTGRIELNADEVKALASSNPKVLELVKVRNEAGQLRSEYYGYRQEQGNIQSQIANKTHSVESTQRYLEKAEAELKTMPSRDDLHSDFKVTIGKKKYSKRSEIGAALVEAMPVIDSKDEAKKAEQIKELANNPVKIGSVLGKPLFAGRSDYDKSALIYIGQKDGDYFKPSDDDTGNGVKLFNYFDKKYDEPIRLNATIDQDRLELAALQERAGVEWPKSARMKASEESLRRLEAELGSAAGKKGTLPVVSELTKYAIMAEKLGRQEGRAVTFDGTQWMYGDRLPVIPEAVTTEMEREVDNEVQLLLVDSNETPQKSFFFHETEESELRKSAREAKEAIFIQKQKNARYYQDFRDEWARISSGSTTGLGAVITPELLRASGKIVVGEIRVGAKRFSVLIKKLRDEFDDAIVNRLKPTLIEIWNANQSEYGLDDATDVVFDAAMSDTVDVDLETAVASAKAVTPDYEPPPEPSEGDKEFSTQNAFSAVARQELDMPERPPVHEQKREPSIDAAKAYAETSAGAKFIDQLIAELTHSPRAVTPRENDLLNYRHAELDNNLESSLRKQVAAAKNGDDSQEAVAEREARDLRKSLRELIEFVLEPIGTSAGRALQARKAIINRSYTMVRLVLEFEAAHKRAPDTEGHTGELAAMQKQIDDLNAKIAELDKLLAESDAKNNDFAELLKKAHEDLVNKAAATEASPETPESPATPDPAEKAKKAPSAEKTRKEKALERIHRAGDKFRSLMKAERLNSVGGALGTVAEAALEMATGYSELGVVTLGEFLKRASRTIGKEAKRFFPELKAAWKQVRASVSGPADISSITDTIDTDVPDTIGRAARALHAFVIERDGLDASAEGRGAAVVAVHEILVDFVEGITEDETARAMSGIGIYSELSQDEIEVIRRDQKAQLLLIEQIKDWEKARLAELREKGTGVAPPQTGREHGEKSQEHRELEKLRNEAKKRSGVETTSAGQLRSAFAAAMRQVSNRIADLDKAIRTKTPIARSKTVLPDPTGELKALQDERDALQKLYNEAFGRPELTEQQRQIATEKALDSAIAGMVSDLKTGKLYPAAPKAPVTSPAIEAKRAALDALKSVRDEMRVDSGQAEERSNAAYERILKERDAALAKRIADKDFKPREKKPARVLTPAQTKLMHDIAEKKLEIEKQSKAWIFKNRHIVVKVWKKGPFAVAHTLRKLKTGFDQSLIGRQGWLLGLTHPIIYAKAMRKGFASNPVEAKSIYPTKQDVFNTESELDSDAGWVQMEKTGKLAVTGVHGGLARTEEGNNFVPDWVDDIWGVGGSERAGSAFINTQRRLVFRELVSNLATTLDGKRSISAAELRVIGNLVNVASGRGSIGKYTNALEAWTTLFFSPRWWASRLNWWFGQPLWHDAKWTGGEGASSEVRVMAAKEWAKQATAQFMVMGLAVAGLTAAFGKPGEDEEWDWYWDPRSPRFGNIRIKNAYFDMTAGLAQHLSLMARFITGKQVNRWDTEDVDKVRLLMNYGRGKLAPVPSMGWDYAAGKSIGQYKTGSPEWVVSQVEPLISQDIRKAFRNEDIPLASVLSAWMVFGGTAQSFEARTKSRNDVANELRVMKKANESPEKIQKIINAHLKEAAAAEAQTALRTAAPEEQDGLKKVTGEEESPELTAALEKEKQDIILNAASRVSTDTRRIGEAQDFSGSEDKGRMTTRMLVPMMVPDVETALRMYDEAYRERNGSTTEKKGDKRVQKSAVSNGRARIRKLYQNQ